MADIIKKVNALGLLDQYTIAKSLGQEDEFCKSHNIDIEKGGKAAVIGEIREFGGKKYQKQANGWRPVRKGDQKGSDLKDHPQYTKEDYDYLKGKGWSDDKIKERWDEENKKGDAPQTWGKDNKDSNSFANKVVQEKQRSVASLRET